MKFCILNDTHFGARGENPHVNDYFHRFYDEVFFPYMVANNIKTILHLGDVVDRRKFMNFQIWNSWRTRFFDRIRDNGIDLHILLGNHDIYHKNTSDINAMNELVGDYKNVTIYNRATVATFDGLPIALVPWINASNEEHALNFLQTASASVLFGHLEIAGFDMDRGSTCLDGRSREIFNRFGKVYSGHFHHKSDDGHIYYLGNQVEITWADYNENRGFHVFDTETKDLQFIKNPLKLFHKIQYDDTVMDFEYWKNFDYSAYRHSYIKIIIHKKKNPFLFDTVLDSLYKVEPIDIAVVDDYMDEVVDTTVDVDQAEDVPTILSKYIDTKPSRVDKGVLNQLIRELYLEALNTEHTS